MKKNIFKSMIKSIVRVIWKVLFKPLVKTLPSKSRLKERLLRAGGKIERREWWPKPPKSIEYNPHHLNNFLFNELKELGKIEPVLQPSKDFLNQLSQNSFRPFTGLEDNSYGEIYGLILRHLKNLDFDVVFLAPWLKRGGADLGLLHHIDAQHEKGMKVLLITTEDVESVWLNYLPTSVVHLDLAFFTKKLNSYKSVELLARLLLQIPAQSIHNINSPLGWEVFKRFGLQLKSMHKKIFVSIFCEDEFEPNIFFGYAHFLPETFYYLECVFCDTQWYPKKQNQLTGLDNLIKTVYFPFVEKLNHYVASDSKTAPILWASRIARQKRPELLYLIAKAMPEQEFHIYGEFEKNCQKDIEQLRSLSNVKIFGKYDSFMQIVLQQEYSAFLYTSAYDGLPNVLIESIAMGLPVIAYDVGGISELIHGDTLLSDSDSFEDNLLRIKNILNNKTLLKDSWQYSHNIVKNRHSWKCFIQTLESIDGYFLLQTQESYESCYENFRILSKPLNNTESES